MSTAPAFLAFARADLSLRHRRQELIATNIANADTPGYKARDINFSKALHSALDGGRASPHAGYVQRFPVGLDGNDVSPTAEKLESIRNDGAAGAEVTFLHQATQNLLTAIRPNPNGT